MPTLYRYSTSCLTPVSEGAAHSPRLLHTSKQCTARVIPCRLEAAKAHIEAVEQIMFDLSIWMRSPKLKALAHIF